MARKAVAWILLVASIIMVAAGCSSKSEQVGVNQTPPPVVKKDEKPIDLHLYSASGQNDEWFETTYGKYLKAKFPHITFKVHFPSVSSLKDYVATREPLDIVFGAYPNFYTGIRVLDLQNDISDLIKKDGYNMDRFEPTVVDLQRQMAGGGIYGLPAFIGTSGLYYNKDLFDKFAVPYPKEGITWDEVYDLAVKLTRKDGGVQYYGFGNDNLTYLQVNQLSLDLVDPKTFKASFNTDAWKKVVQTLTKFMTIPGVDIAQATPGNFNTKGTVAMATNYSGCCGFTPGAAVTNWGVVRIPAFPDYPNVGPQVFPNYWFMSSTSKYREQAFEVMKYIASEEFQTSMNARGLATALKDRNMFEKYGQELPIYAGKNMSVLFPKQFAKMSNITEYQILAATKLNAALAKIAKDGQDINTALREAAEAADKDIETAKAAKK